jgi:hypothetical protein
VGDGVKRRPPIGLPFDNVYHWKGIGEKTGKLIVRKFYIADDEVFSSMFNTYDTSFIWLLGKEVLTWHAGADSHTY